MAERKPIENEDVKAAKQVAEYLVECLRAGGGRPFVPLAVGELAHDAWDSLECLDKMPPTSFSR